jgi:hypothetical protein
MPKFMLLLHEDPSGFAELSPQDIETVVREYTAWRVRLAEEGRVVGGEKLADEGGRWLTAPDGAVRVVDGPFAEAKEVIGGYFMVQAADYGEAVQVARTCPHLRYGGRIELRQVEDLGG